MASSVIELELEPERTETDEPVNWIPIRSVYRKLHTDFHVLTNPFGIRISHQLNRDLAHLIGAIDCVDRELDGLDEAAHRQSFGKSLIRYLRGESPALAVKPAKIELVSRLQVLRTVILAPRDSKFVLRYGRKDPGAHRGETSIVRQTSNDLPPDYRMEVDRPFKRFYCLAPKARPISRRFFYLACEMMPAIDTIQDARSDYQQGQIRIRPSIGLYTRLSAMFVFSVTQIAVSFSGALELVQICVFISYRRYGESREMSRKNWQRPRSDTRHFAVFFLVCWVSSRFLI